MYWRDRWHAGEMLAQKLLAMQSALPNPLVLGIPRGGVVVGFPIAYLLKCPLDVIVTKKISHPAQPELAIGAISAAGEVVLDRHLHEDPDDLPLQAYVALEAERMLAECQRRQRRFRGERPPLDLKHRSVIVVDDGIATGLTTLAALRQLRQEAPGLLLLATPVIPAQQVPRFIAEVDHLLYLHAPDNLMSVGQYYQDFAQTEDEEVIELLQRAPAPV